MSLGELNKGAVALIMVLLLGAAGYLWYSMLYSPAVDKRVAAVAAQQTAEQELATAKSDLAAAQQRVEESKKDAGKLDDSVSRLQIARGAVPNEKAIDDAAIVLMDIAKESGIETTFEASDDPQAASSTTAVPGPEGSTPIDLTFKAVGTYPEMMLFMRNVESTVDAKKGKLYSRGRLFNVVKLEIGQDDESTVNGGGFGTTDTATTDDGELPVHRGEMRFKVTIRMYTSSTENAQGVGAATPDPAAAPVDGATGTSTGAGTGTTTTDPNAANSTGTGTTTGGTTSDPNAAGTGTSSTTGGTTSGTPTTTAGAPTGG